MEDNDITNNSYVLVTAARNEESYIQMTIESVISQTFLPKRWVIVSDGSTDNTDRIVEDYARKHHWIYLRRMRPHDDYESGKQAECLNEGWSAIKGIGFQYVGFIDADISFESDLMAFLIDKFNQFSKLGVAGVPFIEGGDDVGKRRYYNVNHVHGAFQIFRRKCFEDMEGFIPISIGSHDKAAVITARMHGWETMSFREKRIVHHRFMGAGYNNIYRASFNVGQRDYLLGNATLWELARVLYQMTKKPYIFKGVLILYGYFSAFLRKRKRPVSDEFVAFAQREQVDRLKATIRNVFKTNIHKDIDDGNRTKGIR